MSKRPLLYRSSGKQQGFLAALQCFNSLLAVSAVSTLEAALAFQTN